MPTSYPERQAQLRALIQTFLTERLDGKLEALKPDDPKRAELQTQFAWRTWIDDAARRSAQIQCATHTLKPIHPDARGTRATLNKPSKISAQTWMTQFFGLLCLSRGPFGQFAGR